MSIQANNSLCAALLQLERALDNLSWAIVQGLPKTEQGHALADYYEESAMEMMGLMVAAREALRCNSPAMDALEFAQLREGLILCQQNFNQVSNRFYCDLVSFERLSELDELVQRKGLNWVGWAHGIKDALGQCHQPLYELSKALLQEWCLLTGAVTANKANEANRSKMNVGRDEPGIRLMQE